MFFTKKLHQKGCLFPNNCNRKGTVSETALAHPRTKIRQVPPRANAIRLCKTARVLLMTDTIGVKQMVKFYDRCCNVMADDVNDEMCDRCCKSTVHTKLPRRQMLYEYIILNIALAGRCCTVYSTYLL